jgi:hypothetical protein
MVGMVAQAEPVVTEPREESGLPTNAHSLAVTSGVAVMVVKVAAEAQEVLEDRVEVVPVDLLTEFLLPPGNHQSLRRTQLAPVKPGEPVLVDHQAGKALPGAMEAVQVDQVASAAPSRP